uniref:ClpN n=1 Tax=Poteriospumella lacustris TaxID=1117027 RepID=A0A7S6TCG7_9STRA|nr:ClpN [Poteriospumella lacustris]
MLPNFSQGNFFNLKLDFNNFTDLHEKIKFLLANPKVKEKRRRNLANFIFNCTLQQSTYFDFFSQDSIKSLVLAKKITQILKERKVSEETLFLSLCLNSETSIYSLIKKNNIDNALIIKGFLGQEKYKEYPQTLKKNIEQKIVKMLSSFFLKDAIAKQSLKSFFNEPITSLSRIFLMKRSIKKKKSKLVSKYFAKLLSISKSLKQITFSSGSFLFFEQAMKLANEKYKTPIITTDILTLLLLESSKVQSVTNRIARMPSLLKEMKYILIRSLYDNELAIKDENDRNLYYFCYLLKIGSSEQFFHKVIQKEDLILTGNLSLKAFSIRDFLVKKLIRIKFLKLIENEVIKSVFVNSLLRIYKYHI